ncbi:MAG: hypothetical protein FJ291_03980 [Planctomycetes bacterium]|nr:hypothetical protein [Planctomycetota bacterium]
MTMEAAARSLLPAAIALAASLAAAWGGEMKVAVSDDKARVDVHEGDKLVLRYWFGTAPLPEGIPARYACGGYIHPLCGPDGESLTDAHPKDHAHHRGVMWSWPVLRWKDKVTDPWAVSGTWTRPQELRTAAVTPAFAQVAATSVWKWGDKEPVLREETTIRAFPAQGRSRVVDIDLTFEALVDELALGGRPGAGYGGFGLRFAPRKDQKITLFTDPAGKEARRSWIEYSDTFAGGTGRVGVAIFEHPSNPLYPSALQQYPNLSYVMPAFPGPREFPLPKGKTLALRHRLWIHPDHADEKALGEQWNAYATRGKD